MKLKKIASLMLAGIMAVSMLAGCKGASNGTEEKPENVTTGSSVVEIVNNYIKGNDAGVSFTADAELGKKLEIVIRESGVNAKDTDLAKALATELEVTNGNFDATKLNTKKDKAEVKSTTVYKFSDKNESELSAAYKATEKIDTVVDALKASEADSSTIYNYTYSNAHISMASVTVDDANYFFVAVTLNSNCEKA